MPRCTRHPTNASLSRSRRRDKRMRENANACTQVQKQNSMSPAITSHPRWLNRVRTWVSILSCWTRPSGSCTSRLEMRMSIELRLLDIASELAGLIARGWTNYIIYIENFFTYILFAVYHDVRTGKRSYSFLPSPDLVVTQAYCDVSTRRDGTHNRNLSPRAMSLHREARRKKCRASVTFRIGLCFRWWMPLSDHSDWIQPSSTRV